MVPRPSGLSLVLSPSGTPVALTWFGIAKTIWADDRSVQAAVRKTMVHVAHHPDSPELYDALSSGPDDGRWRHGMVGIGVACAGDAWLQAGVRPT